MNFSKNVVSALSSKETSARPPAVGKEDRRFEDVSYQSRYIPSKMQDSEKFKDYNNRTDSVTSHKASESASCESSSLPSPYRWAQSLQDLLEDMQGVSLFRQFLEQEGHDTKCLDFWFACRGLKKEGVSDQYKLIKVIYEKKVKRISCITSETKSDIKQRLSSKSKVDVNVFDAAQREVEAFIMKTTYPNFLTSDIYIQQLGASQSQTYRECLVSPEATDLLPTLHEDRESFFMNKGHSSLWGGRKISSTKVKPESQAGTYLKSSFGKYSAYHTKYAPFLPASAQDSELQSLSSDAQTDDAMSQTDCSSVDFSMSRSKQKTKSFFRSSVMNRDKLLNDPNFIPRTQRDEVRPATAEEDPLGFHKILVDKLNSVLNKQMNNQRTEERMTEKLKSIESSETKHDDVSTQKNPQRSTNVPEPPTLNPPFPNEDNVQDILDQHLSRVFDDTGLTPALSPECASPPVVKHSIDDFPRLPISCQSSVEGACRELSYSASQKEPDTHSFDSGAMTDWVSEDNLPGPHRPTDNTNSSDFAHIRRTKRLLSKKLSAIYSSSSCVDSGISTINESVQPAHNKVSSWLDFKRCTSDSEKEYQRKNSSSPVLSRSSFTRKPALYNSFRSASGEFSQPAQPFAVDPTMPPLPQPDTTTSLLEAKRRLEDENRMKKSSKHLFGSKTAFDGLKGRMSFRASESPVDEGISHRKQSRKSYPNTIDCSASTMGSNDMTVIGYSYGAGSVPYKSRLPGKNITLRQFKSSLNKKGNFRYFFKRVSDDFGTGIVLEEVTEDHEILPLWEGKVFCIIERMDDNCSAMNDEL